MSDLNVYITTFNCGRTPVHVDYFATTLFNGLTTNLPPDLVVLCLEEIAPIASSFLGGTFLTPYFTAFTTAVNLAAKKSFESSSTSRPEDVGGFENAPAEHTEVFASMLQQGMYSPVTVRNVGMTAVMVFARAGVLEKVRWIETAGVGVGVWEMGNKGAVGVRLGLSAEGEEAVVTFVGAHLAPMEDAWERRGQDWKNICQGLVFERDGRTKAKAIGDAGTETEPLLASGEDHSTGTHTLFSPVTHIFFAGDLNYRTSDTSPKPADWSTWPQPLDSVHGLHKYDHMLERDQLTRELRRNATLHNLAEAEITFPPTYKYSTLAQKHAAEAERLSKSDGKKIVDKHGEGDGSWLWAKHRVPSWCDRVLYLAAAPPKVLAYTALPVQPTSDHRPVVFSFTIPLKAVGGKANEVKPPFAVREHWREARAAARRYELIVGVLSYLTLTWEGEALLFGTVFGVLGGYIALRMLIAA